MSDNNDQLLGLYDEVAMFLSQMKIFYREIVTKVMNCMLYRNILVPNPAVAKQVCKYWKKFNHTQHVQYYYQENALLVIYKDFFLLNHCETKPCFAHT